MLQYTIGWGIAGFMSAETLQIIFRNLNLKDYKEMSWYGFIGMSAGFIRGIYGISFCEFCRQFITNRLQ